MKSKIWISALLLGALGPAIAPAATVTEPGPNGPRPAQVAPDSDTR